LQVLFLLTAIALAPTMLLMLTSFTRIINRARLPEAGARFAAGAAEPCLARAGALHDRVIMARPSGRSRPQAIEPYLGRSDQTPEALQRGLAPLRGFMLRNTRDNDTAAVPRDGP